MNPFVDLRPPLDTNASLTDFFGNFNLHLLHFPSFHVANCAYITFRNVVPNFLMGIILFRACSHDCCHNCIWNFEETSFWKVSLEILVV